MFKLMILYLILLLYTFAVMIFFNEKFGKCLPVSFVVLSLETFACSAIGTVFYLKYALVASVLFCVFIIYIKRKKISIDTFKSFFNMGLIIFTIFFIFIYIRTSGIKLSNIDDLNYYSRLVKDSLRNGVFYTKTQQITMRYNGYPPFCTLLESAFCILLGSYNESYLIFSMVLFSLSFFIVLFDELSLKTKDIVKALLIFLTIIVLTLSIQQNRTMGQQIYIYNSIYNDWLISIITAFIFYLVFTDKVNLFVIVVVGSALCLIKPHCLPLYALAIFGYFLVEKFKKQKKIKEIIPSILILLIPLLIYVGFSMYAAYFDTKNVLSASVKTLGSVKGKYSSLATAVFVNYAKALFVEPVMTKPFNMSFVIIIIIQIIILNFINKENKKEILITYTIGALGYSLMMYLVFVGRGPDEGVGLVMYGRYMQTYTYIGMLLIGYLFINRYKDSKILLTLYLFISMVFIDFNSVKYINPFSKVEIFKEKEREELQYYFDQVYNNEKMAVLICGDINYAALIVNIIDTKNENISRILYSEADDKAKENFINTCKENELLLICDYDDSFYENVWKDLTDSPCFNSSIYKINKNENGDIDFELLYTWDN